MAFRGVLFLTMLATCQSLDVQKRFHLERELQDAVCTATLANGTVLEFDEGESFGSSRLTRCGSPEEFPCFCSALEDDRSRCPYCPFLNNASAIECATSGESLTFFDEFSVEQTCTCQYLGNNTFETFCDPRDVLPDVCALQRNTERCPELTEFINYDPECQCLSFCLGQFSGCCNFRESCSVTCTGSGATVDDIVSGCTIDPNKPPVSAPPATPQIPAPRECVFRRNEDNCPALVTAQEPVAGCGPNSCYNYCNNEFQNCCEDTDQSCVVSCAFFVGEAAPTVTAGCRLPSCKFFGQVCVSSGECCSESCIGGACTRPRVNVANRQKLSGDRGGQGGVSKEGNRRLGAQNKKEEKVRGS